MTKTEAAPTLIAKLSAECIGTMILCFTVNNGILGGSPLAALAIASSLMVAVYSLGSVSGAHLNPAVTLGVFLAGKLGGPGGGIPLLEAALYPVMQLLGGAASSVLASWLWSTDLGGGFSADAGGMLARVSGKLGNGGRFSNARLFEGEVLYTMMLVFVVLNVATCNDVPGGNSYFGLAIGFVIAAAASAEAVISGTCLNPAVTFGIFVSRPAKNAEYLPLYWGAQVVGSCLAVAMFYGCRLHLFKGRNVPSMASKLLAEFFGTFMLVVTVCLVVAQGSQAPVIGIIGIASSLMCMIYSLWNVSGANFNPAVSFGLLLTGNLSAGDFATYVVAQLLGGLAAVGIAMSFYPDWTIALASNSPNAQSVAKGSEGAVAGAEIFYTGLLVFAVLNTAVRDAGNQYFGLVIGFCVIVGGVAVGGLSGGNFNPAVTLSLFFGGLIHGHYHEWVAALIYPASQLAGAALAAGAFKLISLDSSQASRQLLQADSGSENEGGWCA
ncbi:unnamed protein product [Polarella glacialis]|uniref:Aquaporin n=2 Tax=Polarella glacialis TaxID=89957 RepID=A0A813IP07_POLGL|nr:unnamed protein product [Polarella glacialis]